VITSRSAALVAGWALGKLFGQQWLKSKRERASRRTALSIVGHHLRLNFAHFNLRAHLLDLRGLLFELHDQNLLSLFLVGNGRFLCCDACFLP
jgi:hypothetical protein